MTYIIDANNATAQLGTSITSSSTTISLISKVNWPTITGVQVIRATITNGVQREIIDISATNTITRGVEGTTAQAWTSGSTLEIRPTAGKLKEKQNRIANADDVINFGDAVSLEIPNSAAPSVTINGQIALDNTVTDYTNGLVVYRSGSTNYGVVALTLTDLTSPTDNYVVTYDATNDKFKLAAGGGGGGGSGNVVGPGSATDNALTRFDSTTGKLLQNSVGILDDDGNLTANNISALYTTTATAAGTTTLVVGSTQQQFFTGTTTQTIVLPVVTTLPRLGYQFRIVNDSTGIITVQSSGAIVIKAMAAGTSAIFTCKLLTGTTAASWSVAYFEPASGGGGVASVNGQTGVVVLDADDISVSGTTNKFTTSSDITKLSGIETAADVTDTTNVIASLSGASITAATIATDDKVIIQDTSSSNVIKTVTTQSIRDLTPTTAAAIINGGTGQISYTNGQLLIGNTTGNTLTKATLTAGAGVSITNSPGGITVATSEQPSFSVYMNTSQVISTSTFTKVILDTEISDTNSFFDATTNYRFTPTIAGTYLIVGAIQFTLLADQKWFIATIYKNGAPLSRFGSGFASGASSPTAPVVAPVYFNGSTDYIELYAYHEHGSNRNLQNGAPYTYLTGIKIGS